MMTRGGSGKSPQSLEETTNLSAQFVIAKAEQ